MKKKRSAFKKCAKQDECITRAYLHGHENICRLMQDFLHRSVVAAAELFK